MNRLQLYVLFTFLLGLQASSEGNGGSQDSSLPVTYPAAVFEGGDQICPPEEDLEMARTEFERDLISIIRDVLPIQCPGQSQENPAASCLEILQCNRQQLPSEYYWITSSDGTAIQIFCDMTRECSCNSSSAGGWARVAYLNMTDPAHQCPPAWMEITDPVRACARTNETLPQNAGGGCSIASYSVHNISYSHICGRIVAYQFGTTDAFWAYDVVFTRIVDPYVDGVVILRGDDKQHVWTFVSELSEGRTDRHVCPCTPGSGPNTAPTVPPFIGENYFCETGSNSLSESSGVFYSGDPLWDGENCGSGSACCEFNGPPYFCRSLPEPVTDDIEVRICADEAFRLEHTPVELVEIFVQ